MNKNILLTGGSGFIGTNLINYLSNFYCVKISKFIQINDQFISTQS